MSNIFSAERFPYPAHIQELATVHASVPGLEASSKLGCYTYLKPLHVVPARCLWLHSPAQASKFLALWTCAKCGDIFICQFHVGNHLARHHGGG